MEQIGNIQYDRIWMLKAISIFTVFFAHMPWTGNNPIMHKVYCLLGIIGVPIFLFLSGYVRAGSKSPISKRVKKLCVPLLLWGSFTFFVQYLINNKFFGEIIFQYFRWVFGSGSIYYFVPLLLMCIVLSKFCNSYLLIILSIVSIALSWNYIPHNQIITRYLNPFNFILYFELGKIARMKNLQITNNIVSVFGSFLILIIIGIIWPTSEPCYFSILCIPFVVAAFIFLNGILRLYPLRFLVPIGKYSFVIYLCHIHIAGIVNGRLYGWMEFIKVPIAFLITCIFVSVVNKVVQNIYKEGRLLEWLGYR